MLAAHELPKKGGFLSTVDPQVSGTAVLGIPQAFPMLELPSGGTSCHDKLSSVTQLYTAEAINALCTWAFKLMQVTE